MSGGSLQREDSGQVYQGGAVCPNLCDGNGQCGKAMNAVGRPKIVAGRMQWQSPAANKEAPARM
jgi:hypothetical protein